MFRGSTEMQFACKCPVYNADGTVYELVYVTRVPNLRNVECGQVTWFVVLPRSANKIYNTYNNIVVVIFIIFV